MKILTGFAVIKDSVGSRITFTHSVVAEDGTITSSNNKESFVVLDAETKELIKKLEDKISARM